MKEYSLHSQVKEFYRLPGDVLEAKLGSYVVDILRGALAIEVQTKNFSALKQKLAELTKTHQVRLVYPLHERKWITHINEDGAVLKTRKSPRTGQPTDVFRELTMIPFFIGIENFSLEVLLVDEEEIRCADGRGSWRRTGISVKDRRLLRVNSRLLFQTKADYAKVLPENLARPFTNRELAKAACISVRTAQQITYCLGKCGVLETAEKRGKAPTFRNIQ